MKDCNQCRWMRRNERYGMDCPHWRNMPYPTCPYYEQKEKMEKKDYGSIVRNNLMYREGYSPYCGNPQCIHCMPRTTFDGEQFYCRCGWRSSFPKEFIEEYKSKWRNN